MGATASYGVPVPWLGRPEAAHERIRGVIRWASKTRADTGRVTQPEAIPQAPLTASRQSCPRSQATAALESQQTPPGEVAEPEHTPQKVGGTEQ